MNIYLNIFSKFKNCKPRNGSIFFNYFTHQNIVMHSNTGQCTNAYHVCTTDNIKKGYLHYMFYIKYNFLSSTSLLCFTCSNGRKKKYGKFENPYEELLKNKKAKENYDTLILVLDGSDKATIMTLKDAQKHALLTDKKLVKINDPMRHPKGDKPLYQLMSGKQYYEEYHSKKKKKEADSIGIKGEKEMQISSKIGSGDLEVKMKKMRTFLKNLNVVTINVAHTESEENASALESISSHIEKSIAGIGKISQKASAGKGLKFEIYPLLPEEEKK